MPKIVFNDRINSELNKIGQIKFVVNNLEYYQI